MTLRDELLEDPLDRGYSFFLDNAPGLLADMLNARAYLMVKERFVTARGVLDTYGMNGAILLEKLEQAAPTNPAVKWALKFAAMDSGINVGSQTTRALLDSLVPAVLTQGEVDMIKDMAIQPASRAEILGLGYVYERDVQAALD